METLGQWFEQAKSILDVPLIPVGGTWFTLWNLLYLFLLLFILIYLTGKFRSWIVNRLLARSQVNIGVRQAIASIVRYGVLALGFIIIVQSSGIDLSALTVLAGALGIGVGFGLQNIINNFVSGLIILFERPIKVGDRIEVGEVAGNVVNISPRATTVVTNDNIAVIVPNSDFISSKVINWSYTDRDVRLNFPVGVSYASDPEVVRRVLHEVAVEHPGVLENPAPDVLFREFGDSSLNFNLRVWTRQFSTTPGVLRSQLYYEIWKKLKANQIEIPFPQRDLHVRSGSLEIKMAPVDKPS